MREDSVPVVTALIMSFGAAYVSPFDMGPTLILAFLIGLGSAYVSVRVTQWVREIQ